MKALHRPADNFDGVPANHFDAIVLSAMIMYFPNMAYVSDVMRKSAAALRDGGCVCVQLPHTTTPGGDGRRRCIRRLISDSESAAERVSKLLSVRFYRMVAA